MPLKQRWVDYLNRQHQTPTGLVGQLVSAQMVRQHRPETAWSLALLDLQPTDRVLELGFGAGHALTTLAQRVPQGHMLGLDTSATMVRAAARRNRTALAAGQLTLLRGDLAHVPIGAAQLDKIVSIHTFYFWPDAEATCRQLTQLLAPGGRLVCTFATARRQPDGSWKWWPIHEQAQRLVHALQQHAAITAALASGPDSRQFNNIAIIVDRATTTTG
jgi:ubiquinone/menaquinone biosynthesis C-methylase UbiE